MRCLTSDFTRFFFDLVAPSFFFAGAFLRGAQATPVRFELVWMCTLGAMSDFRALTRPWAAWCQARFAPSRLTASCASGDRLDADQNA